MVNASLSRAVETSSKSLKSDDVSAKISLKKEESEKRPLITINSVSKHFEVGKGIVTVLKNVSVDIRRGGVFGIIGSSGAGKSTLVRLINLLERPSSGHITINGQSTSGVKGRELRTLRHSIGMVFQHFNLLSGRTVAQNVAYPLQLAGVKKSEIESRVAELLHRVGLTEHAQKYPRQLSGGQKQRVGIARALASKPEILLCDEATSALDPETTQSVLRLLAEINRELGLTIVLITHEMDVVRQVCDHVAVLESGELVETGPVEKIFLHPQHPATHRLLREAEHSDAEENRIDFITADSPIYRLTFLGDDAHRPILGAAAQTFKVDYSIIAGRIGNIGGRPFAQLTVAFVGGDVLGAATFLKDAGVTVEQLEARNGRVSSL